MVVDILFAVRIYRRTFCGVNWLYMVTKGRVFIIVYRALCVDQTGGDVVTRCVRDMKRRSLFTLPLIVHL